MKKVALILILTLALAIIPMASAEIFISQPQKLYNLGDNLNLNLFIQPNANTNDFFTVKLNCNFENTSANNVEIYKTPLSLSEGDSKNVTIETALNNFLVGNLGGNCYISADYGNEFAKTQSFTITRDIDVIAETNKLSYNPGDKIKITGNAIKKNGESLNGFYEISILKMGVKTNGAVSKGNLTSEISIPKNAESGSSNISIETYEIDNSGEMTNSGNATLQIKINQILSTLNIIIQNKTFSPDSNVSFTPVAYDQAGDEIQNNIEVKLYDASGNLVSDNVIPSEKEKSIYLLASATPGKWKFVASSGELKNEKTFYVTQSKKISYSLENDTLIVTNEGNVPYENSLEIFVGNESQVVDVSVEVGGSQKINLEGTKGKHEIKIGSKNNQTLIGSTFITGNSISGFSIVGGGSATIIAWAIIIILALIVVIYFYRKIRKKRFIGKTPSNVEKISTKKSLAQDTEPEDNIDSGEKEESVIISLTIKNSEEIENSPKKKDIQESLNNILAKARSRKAKVYTNNKEKIFVFSKTLTKEKENSLRGLACAQEIKDSLDNYNKLHSQKISFGIGVNLGNMIVERKDKNIKFASIDNTISTAKKLSNDSNGNIILSEKIHGRVIGKVKSEKGKSENQWILKSVPDRSRHEDFLRKFAKRQKENKSK